MENPTSLFEVSWEVCNKVGGIHTVISTKALNMVKELGNNYILIGPDVWRYTETNPEFIDDPKLLRSWHAQATKEGLRIKIGRWNVAGNPIVILVDFSSYITQKDTIFASFWDQYKLDSISGQWDYIEPALFGYAAGKVIESFIHYQGSVRQHNVAQFHEWMTGTGLLYLKKALPQVGNIFTTHATVLGRSIAGNNMPLYGEMNNYVPDELAARFNVISKQSLEKAAAQNADCFTTVSEITAVECEHFLGKKVDVITPNGFENVFVPNAIKFESKRTAGREKFLQVAQALLGRSVSEDALIIGISGRYEFKNKGIDVFLDALGKLNKKEFQGREILAFILVPAGHEGANKELVNNLEQPYQCQQSHTPYLTHYLTDQGNDPVMNKIRDCNLTNTEHDKIKIFFAPCYLNGYDGVFNLSYYDLLIGMDLTLFPSYYEPWGYTPLESLAFSVPTITTTLAGFGLWVREHCSGDHSGIEVIERGDFNNEDVVNKIIQSVEHYATIPEEKIRENKNSAKQVSQIALWDNLMKYYKEAYHKAISKSSSRSENVYEYANETVSYIEKHLSVNEPTWVSIMIHRSIPEKLKALDDLSQNLWWSWNDEASELFQMVDPEHWDECEHNPISLLDKISLSRYKQLEENDHFVSKLNRVSENFKSYMAKKNDMQGAGIAYFSMEYGLHHSLKIYSGGLGVLAGDYLKEASDKGTKMTAVGLLYRYGYFTQKLSSMGDQEAKYEAQNFMKIPISPLRDSNGNWEMVSLVLPGRNLYARIWRVDVGRVELYLMDTDFDNNLEEDRSITHHLYGGDWENRLKQELLLGCGGIQVLRKLKKDATIYHCNEGHAAFTGLERVKEYVTEQKLSFDEAMEVVRASSLFTTHTPVPAGHDSFSETMLRTYISYYADRLKINWTQLLGLGKLNVNDPNEKFSMSFLAANMAQEINGVSMLHGKVSREIFKGMWPGYMPEELHISYVTNGVHYPTWAATEWKTIHNSVFGSEFQTHHYDKKCFEEIYKVPDSTVHDVRNILRKKMIDEVKRILSDDTATNYFTPGQVIQVQETLRDDILTISFARRFATYKRAHLLFKNIERLDEIVNNAKHPVQFIFAGKAHPADKAGQDLIKRIVEVSKLPQFLGKIIFLPNYNMELAKLMIQGSDVWMNTPTRPQEASGTSGEKAAMNGVMHFSVLDGWWVEGYRADAGWMLPMKRTYENQAFQDELDSELIYNIIDNDIAPLFYAKDATGISSGWVKFIKNTIAKVASNFTSNRMLIDYEQKYYIPMAARSKQLTADNYKKAIEIAAWKNKVTREWDNVELAKLISPYNIGQIIELGKSYQGEIAIDTGELTIDDIGVELVVTEESNGDIIIRNTYDFTPVSEKDGTARFKIDVKPNTPGLYRLAVRIFPKHDFLPHKQDFALVKWL